jgi:hypothetical protein
MAKTWNNGIDGHPVFQCSIIPAFQLKIQKSLIFSNVIPPLSLPFAAHPLR